MAALDRFFAGREHLAIEFADLMSNPRREVERLMEYLHITAEADKIEAAVHFIEPGRKSKVEAEQGEKIGAGKEPGWGPCGGRYARRSRGGKAGTEDWSLDIPVLADRRANAAADRNVRAPKPRNDACRRRSVGFPCWLA